MKVRCVSNRGYYNLTIGKEYEVKELTPRLITPHFTFPRYVSVIDDEGEVSSGHAYRFETLDGVCCDEYIKENLTDKIDKDY